MNIFLREIKAHRKSLIFWCIGMFFMIVAGMVKYLGYSSSGPSINDLVAQIPKSIQSVLGFGTFDLTKATGFYGMLYLYLTVMAAIHASMLGAGIISKEERDKTSEFLFVKPVSRNRIIASKILAAFVNIIVLNIITCTASMLVFGYYGKGEDISGEIMKLMTGMFILQLMYMFIGTGVAAVSKKPKTAASTATGIMLFTFILSVAVDMSVKLEGLKYFTPFKYFSAKDLMVEGFNSVFIILSIAIIAALLSITFVFFKKRDLHV